MAYSMLKNNFILPVEKDSTSLVESIKTYIKENDCPVLSMDISHLNIIEASKVTAICSTYHWAKYPDGEIKLKINSKQVSDLINPLDLGNIHIINE